MNYQFLHVILTRFNMVKGDSIFEKGLDENWLEHRCHIFEKYCFPSIMNQTNKNFKWLLFCSDKTPNKFYKRLKSYEKSFNNIYTVFVEDSTIPSSEHILKNKNLMNIQYEYILTSRIDNDDAISKYYVEKLQNKSLNLIRNYKILESVHLNFKYGCLFYLNNNTYYRFSRVNSPFASIIEPLTVFSQNNDKINIFKFPHVDNGKYFKTFHLDENDSSIKWMIIIHTKNVSNNRIKCNRYSKIVDKNDLQGFL